jgi:Tfp pilus assembly protein PilZ
MKPSHRERRRATRKYLGGAAEILENVRGEWSQAIARDVSRLGMFVETVSPYRVGEEVTVRFVLPTCSCQVEVRGRIVRAVTTGEATETSRIGVGIEFIEPADWALAEVVRFIEERGPDMRGATVVTDD